jgi:signal transduction histidine kinase
MLLSQTALALIGLLLAAWTVAAGWAVLAARSRARRAEASQRLSRRLGRMIDEAPALPLLVRSDGRIEGPPRLARWFGLEAIPGYLSELDGGGSRVDGGLDADQLAELNASIRRTEKSAAPFTLVLTPRGSTRCLALRGHLADPQVSSGGAVLVWVFDYSDSEAELRRLRAETGEAQERFAALVGLIEAAPLPMWFRGPDMRLRLVNSAYVASVGAESADAVVEAQTELIEPAGGQAPAHFAAEARRRGKPIERVVAATVAGPHGNRRRALRVSDLPLGDEGVAGYAVDIEELEEQTRAFAAFRAAQRDMLDTLSSGIAQFDAQRRLTFANEPFQRQFAVSAACIQELPSFDQVLERMRDNGRLPEVRDFPEWRRERHDWFAAGEAREEPWLLSDGTHLRVVAQPIPDGGLLLIAEDRTEQLRLAATRDTLLRTRTAMLDKLFEAVAVFAPDGRLQIRNRRFGAAWGVDEALLDEHPKADLLIARIAEKLDRPTQVDALGEAIESATLERQERGGRLRLADGRTLEFAGVPLPDGNGLLTVLDITAAQKAETALKERNAALVEADLVKTRFIANMAYEFRTPLTSIGGFAELLLSGLAGELNDRAREYVDAILASVQRLGEQIENVLDLGQSEAGTLPFRREPVEMRMIVAEALAQIRGRAAEARVALGSRATDTTVPVEGDPRLLRRAIGQLLDNAIAATPAGGQVVVEVARRPKGGARVVVSDNGPGMEPALLARALQGLRAAPDGTTVERRQGLGLPLARQLVEGHGGRLELVSEPGQGTSAIVILP